MVQVHYQMVILVFITVGEIAETFSKQDLEANVEKLQ